MSIDARFTLSGRTAVVTGSSRGIGAALAVGLAEAGADVAVHYAGNRAAAERVAARVREAGRRSCVIGADLAEADAAPRISEAAEATLGPVDILVHNASVQHREPWSRISREQFDQQMRVNLQAVLELTQRLTPAMAERGWGRVLMIGSVQQAAPHPEMAVYAASKAALDNLTRNLAAQLAGRGVTVNNLAPGAIDTDRNRDALSDAAYRQRVIDRIPAGRIGDPDDCVGAALLLASDAGAYITGQTLYVDGGMSL